LSDNITVRPYREGDEVEIVELLELAFDGWPNFDLPCTSLEHWQWKYKDNPQDKRIITLAELDDKIVACHHQLLDKMKIGSQLLLCSTGVDVAVHPDHRKKGIRRLVRGNYDAKKKMGVKLRFNIIPYPYALQFQQREQSPSLPYRTILHTRFRDINLFLLNEKPKYHLLKKYGFHISKIANKLRLLFSKSQRKTSRTEDFDIKTIKRFDDRINVFWNKVKDHYDFIIERNKDYLNWRYCDPRGGEYIVMVEENDDEILGYIVLRIKREKGSNEELNSKGYIIDLLASSDRFDVVDNLLNTAIQYFDEKEVNIVQAFSIKNHPFETMFRKHDLIDSKVRIGVFYTYSDERQEPVDLSSPARIHVQYGDSDWI
jgi:GNAT superfamily N-acetyltransferase